VTQPLSYLDLIETFPRPGCAVCNLVLRDADRFLDTLLYEAVNMPETHQAFRAGRGLCNAHSWQLLRYNGNSLGISILYRAVVDETLKILDGAPDPQPGLARLWGGGAAPDAVKLADSLEPSAPCPACKAMGDAEKRYVKMLGQHLDQSLEEAYRASDGLGLPHFRQALRQTRAPEPFRRLIAIQRAIWSKLKADLEEFADKSDYRRAREPMGAEGDSWQRAVGRMAGEAGVFGANPR
jgi:hypothetical protein